MPRPIIIAWMSLVPSYVLTVQRLIACLRMWQSQLIPLPPCMSRAQRAIAIAFMQEFLLIIEIIQTASYPFSFSLETWRTAWSAKAISTCMSANFFWISWNEANGTPNCLRSRVYCLAAWKQNYAAPNVPQEIPNLCYFIGLPGIVQTRKWSFQSFDCWEHVAFRDSYLVHTNVTRYGCLQRQLAVNLICHQSLHSFLENESPNLSFFIFGPDYKHISNWRICNPHFLTSKDILVSIESGSALHSSWVRAMIWLCQTKAPNKLTFQKSRQIFVFLLLRSKFTNRVNYQGTLDAQSRPVSAIYSLHFPVNESIRCV